MKRPSWRPIARLISNAENLCEFGAPHRELPALWQAICSLRVVDARVYVSAGGPEERRRLCWRVASHGLPTRLTISDAAMLAKCSNPSCSAPFLRLKNGRLFILQADSRCHLDQSERTEYFWLCDACSATMTLRVTEDERVAAVPLPEEIRRLPRGASLVSRHRGKGLLLRSVFLLSERFDDRSGTRLKPRHQAA